MEFARTAIVAVMSAFLGAVTMQAWSLLHEHDPRTRWESEQTAEPSHDTCSPAREPRVSAARAEGGTELARVAPDPIATLRARSNIKRSPLGREPAAMLSPEQRRTWMYHRYGALFKELDLSPAEADKLVQVLSAQAERSAAIPRRDGAARTDDPESQRNAAEIAAVLGPDKAHAFEQLQAALPVRSELRSVRDRLEEAGEPLTGEQHRALVAFMSAPSPDGSNLPPRGDSLLDNVELYRDWVAEREHRLQEAAAKLLTPAQQKTLDEEQQLREAMRPQLSAWPASARVQAGSGG